MRQIPLVCLLAFLFINTPCSAQRQHQTRPSSSGGALLPEQAAYDVNFYDIRLSIHPDDRQIAGAVTTLVTIVDATDHILLDLDDRMSVQDVELRQGDERWREAAFERPAGRLKVGVDGVLQPGDLIEVRVTYSGQPKVAPNPPWVGGFTWAQTATGEPWIATSVQMDGADLWLPVKDHPSDKPDSVALHITVPQGLVVASNGELRNSTSTADSTTFQWFTSMPISNYNIALNIAPYETVEDGFESVDGTQVPVMFWVLPERLDDGRRMLPQFIEHVQWYEELLGPYPFRAEKYGVAHTPHLGMEHQSIIAYGSTFSNNEWGFDWLHHHELGHEWWANLVTAPDWNDFWIHEGFCTYMQPLYIEHLHGQDAYMQEMAAIRGNIQNLKPVAPREPRTTTQMYFVEDANVSDNDIYYKGAWVLHTLRYLVGEEDFFESLRRFAYPDRDSRASTDGSQVRFATTDDYQELVEDITGRDVGWFFEVYLRQADLPRLRSTRDGASLALSWDVPSGLPFPMPVDVRVDGVVQRVEVRDEPVTIDVAPDADVVIDPEGWVLRAR